ILVSDASDSAEEHRQDDEDRPEEDELTAGERGERPDGEGEAGRAGDHAENGAAHTVPVELARGAVDLLRSDPNPIVLEAGQSLCPLRLAQLAGFDLSRIGEHQIVDELGDLAQGLELAGRLGAFVEFRDIELSESIRL